MMTLIRRDPFEYQVSRMLNQFLGDASCNCVEPGRPEQLALDVSENDTSIVVQASVPGFAKDEIDIQVHEQVLSIKASHKQEREEKNERYHRRERRVSALSRQVSLPSSVEGGQTQAELKEGVLTLHIPKTERALPRKVQIK